ncbi:MAG: hypothetical protein R3D32_04105 [Nitratireductor sp.]
MRTGFSETMVCRYRDVLNVRLLLNLVLSLALVMTGFAHRAAEMRNVPFDVAAYVLPDGSLPALCDSKGGNGGKPESHAHPCEFCRIAGSADLAMPVAMVAIADRTALRTGLPFIAVSESRAPLFPSAPQCGPPYIPA